MSRRDEQTLSRDPKILSNRSGQMAPLLELEEISCHVSLQVNEGVWPWDKRIHKKEVLSYLSLAIHKGDIVALIGASGAGKTTLLRVIAGLTTITQGKVRLRGRVVQTPEHSDTPESRSLGVMSQQALLFPHLTVKDNLELAQTLSLNPSRFSSQESGVRTQSDLNELLEALEIQHLTQHYPQQLSGGQKQRVALALTLSRQTDLYLLDEPLGHLEPKLREQIANYMISRCRSNQSSVLWISHELPLALKYADTLMMMHHGQLIAVGTPHQIFHYPSSRTVAHHLNVLSWIPLNELLIHLSMRDLDQTLKQYSDDMFDLGFHTAGWTINDNTHSFNPSEVFTGLFTDIFKVDHDGLFQEIFKRHHDQFLYEILSPSRPLELRVIVIESNFSGVSTWVKFQLLDVLHIKLNTLQPLILSAHLPTYSGMVSGVEFSLTYRGPLFLTTRGDD